MRRIAGAVRGRFILSGGIGSVEDLRAVRELRLLNLAGVISGKALYEGRFTIAEGQEALEAGRSPAVHAGQDAESPSQDAGPDAPRR